MAFGFLVLVWIGAAVMTYVLLQGRPGHGVVSRLLAGLLAGQTVGMLLHVLLVAHGWTLLSDLVIDAALAAWIIWRPGIVPAVLVIVFELLGLASDWQVLAGGAAVIASIVWRAAIVLAAIALAVSPRRRDVAADPLP